MEDEKLISMSLDMLIGRVQDMKTSLGSLLAKLEQTQIDWPQMLDSYALLSGQINNLNKVLKGDRMPVLRNLVLLPIAVALDVDPVLEKATEGRMHSFSHEVVPDALRTKHVPELEAEEHTLDTIANEINSETAKSQIADLNDLLTMVAELISTAREEWETDILGDKQNDKKNNDFDMLRSALRHGNGLKRRAGSG